MQAPDIVRLTFGQALARAGTMVPLRYPDCRSITPLGMSDELRLSVGGVLLLGCAPDMPKATLAYLASAIRAGGPLPRLIAAAPENEEWLENLKSEIGSKKPVRLSAAPGSP